MWRKPGNVTNTLQYEQLETSRPVSPGSSVERNGTDDEREDDEYASDEIIVPWASAPHNEASTVVDELDEGVYSEDELFHGWS